MNKMLKIKGLAVIALSMILMSPMPAFAYKLLEPLPGLNNVNVTLSSYLKWLFPFTLTVVAILAVLMIVVGGTVAATMIGFPLKDFLGVFKTSMKVFMFKIDSPDGLIKTLVEISNKATLS